MTRQRLTVLGVFAHPADMATETGGTLALHAAAGDEVVVAVLTHGGRVHPNIYVEEQRKGPSGETGVAEAARSRVIEIKHAEAEAAARILGITTRHPEAPRLRIAVRERDLLQGGKG